MNLQNLSKPVRVLAVGSLGLGKRMLARAIDATDRRALRLGVGSYLLAGSATGLGEMAGRVGTGQAGWLMMAFPVASAVLWSHVLVGVGKNTVWQQFTWKTRRQRQAVLQACRTNDVGALGKTGMKRFDWTLFENWSMSFSFAKPVSPLDVALQEKAFDVATVLLRHTNGLALPDPDTNGRLMSHVAVLLEGRPGLKEMGDDALINALCTLAGDARLTFKPWLTLALMAPDATFRALLDARGRQEGVGDGEVLIMLFARGIFRMTPTQNNLADHTVLLDEIIDATPGIRKEFMEILDFWEGNVQWKGAESTALLKVFRACIEQRALTEALSQTPLPDPTARPRL